MSVPGMMRYPVKSENEKVRSASESPVRLFAPSYGESKEGWAWSIQVACAWSIHDASRSEGTLGWGCAAVAAPGAAGARDWERAGCGARPRSAARSAETAGREGCFAFGMITEGGNGCFESAMGMRLASI